MGDPTKFHSLWEYYAFNVVFTCLLLSELFIFFYTRQRDSCTQTAKRDHGTKWLLYGNFAFCLLVSICSVSQTAPSCCGRWCSHHCCGYWNCVYCGGDHDSAQRCADPEKSIYASCADAAGQHLVRTGLYHAVRHPAYSGSILSLLGVALTFRNIVAVCIVLFCCLICYSARIRVEEKALLAQFGAEYEGYKRSTHRLLPRIY